jgi:hypothetical protein
MHPISLSTLSGWALSPSEQQTVKLETQLEQRGVYMVDEEFEEKVDVNRWYIGSIVDEV